MLRCERKSHPSQHKERADLEYGPEADVWAVGVLVYELLTGSAPFRAKDTTSMLERTLGEALG